MTRHSQEWRQRFMTGKKNTQVGVILIGCGGRI